MKISGLWITSLLLAASPVLAIEGGGNKLESQSGVARVNGCSGVFVNTTGRGRNLDGDPGTPFRRAPNWLVTAKSCVAALVGSPAGVSISYAGQVRQATSIILHPSLDIALLRIGSPDSTGATPPRSVPLFMELDTKWPSTQTLLDCEGYGHADSPESQPPLTQALLSVLDTTTVPDTFVVGGSPIVSFVGGDIGGPCFSRVHSDGRRVVVGILSGLNFFGSGDFIPAGLFADWAKGKIAETDNRDLTGDGRADLVWQDLVRFIGPGAQLTEKLDTGAWAGLPGDALVVDAQNPLLMFPGGSPTARVVGTADFTCDAQADLLVRNVADGGVWVWNAHGPSQFVAAWDPALEIVGVGDFDGDQLADILTRHSSSGQVAVRLMRRPVGGCTPVAAAGYDLNIDKDADSLGVADFNADGLSDVLWRNTDTGDVNILLLDVRQQPINNSSLTLASVPDLNWKVVAVVDLNHDGMADILWEYEPTGYLGAWILNYEPSWGPYVRWDLDGTLRDSSLNPVSIGGPQPSLSSFSVVAPR